MMPFQQLIADTNPDNPQHWLKVREAAGKLRFYESRHEDNPTLFDPRTGALTPGGRDYIAKLDNLTGVRKDRLRFGRWVQAEGVVYDGWDRNVHLIDPFPIPPEWRRVRSIDFGYTNPFVCQWWAVDHDGRMYLYRELYRTRQTVKVHAGRINESSEGESYELTVADHDAEDRATLRENDVFTQPARKFTAPGRQAVEERLKVQGDGKPRLFVFRDALTDRDESLAEARKPLCTADEFDVYVWPKSKDGKPVKEDPVKENDHGMDAMRYAVMAIDRHVGPQETPEQAAARERAEAEARARAQDEWLSPWNEELWNA
jgi:phage terminase large subunit